MIPSNGTESSVLIIDNRLFYYELTAINLNPCNLAVRHHIGSEIRGEK